MSASIFIARLIGPVMLVLAVFLWVRFKRAGWI